jgi:hypothetical protein
MARRRGMRQREYEDAFRELVFYVVVAPAVILLGMFMAGAFVDAFLHTTNTFSYVFSGVGGIPLLILYFKKEWDRLMNRGR